MSRARRSIKTAITYFSGSVVTTFLGFFTTPVLLRHLGGTRFGLFRAASDWFGYVGLLEFGVGGALQAVFARALGADHRAGVAAGIRAGARAHVRTGIPMFATSCLLGMAMPWLINAPPSLAGELRTGCGVYLIGFVLMPLAVFRPLVEAEQRGYIFQIVNTVQLLIAMTASMTMAVAGWGLVGQFLAVFAGSVVFHLYLAWDGLRRYPESLRGPTAALPPLWSLSWPTMLFNLSGRLSLFTDTILLAAMLGPSAVTRFVLTQRLIQAAGAQAAGLGTAGWAGLVDLHHRGEHATFSRRLIQLTRLSSIAGITLLLPVAIWNRHLITLWVGLNRYAGSAVTWLAAGNAWGLAILSLWGWPLNGSGRVRMLLPAQMIGAAVNLVVSVAGTLTFGLPGPLLGTTVCFAGVSWWWLLRLLHREFGTSRAALIWAAIHPMLLALPYGIMLTIVAKTIPPHLQDWPRWAKWASLAGWLACAAILYLVAAWTLIMPGEDRREFFERRRRIP